MHTLVHAQIEANTLGRRETIRSCSLFQITNIDVISTKTLKLVFLPQYNVMNTFSTGTKKGEEAHVITHEQFMATLSMFPPPPPPPSRSQMNGTWRKQADGHQQHMFLLVQAQLLQAHLELHQRLQQLQSVTGCSRRRRRR